MLLANYHTHTTLCDGSDTPEAVAAEADRLGIKHLGFSGHMDPDIHMAWPDYVKAISALKEQYQGRMDILMGVELDNLYDPACCPGAEYIIGSTHFLDVETPLPMSVDNTPEMMQQLAEGDKTKTVFLPFEATNMLGSLGGIKELFKEEK